MANSRHSVAFRRLFNAVVANVVRPLEERLYETWQMGEKPEVAKQLAQDILHIGSALHHRKQGLTFHQYAFLGDVYDNASWAGTLNQYFVRGGTVDQHTNLIVGLGEWEPPTFSLNLLRGYDAVAKTQVARMYKDLILKILSVTLTHVEKPTAQDNQIIEEFDAFWNEVITAARPSAKLMRSDSHDLIIDLNKAVIEFAVPAREVIKAVDQLTQMPGLKDTEGFIRKSFTNYCAQAILVDSIVDDRELELFHDLAPTLMFFGRHGSIENLKEIFQTAAKNINPSETPLLVSILDVYDNEMKTQLGAKARSLYVRLANTTFKSDMRVCEEEQVWLSEFKQTLYGAGGEEVPQQQPQPVPPPAMPSDEQPVATKMTVDQSLEQLNLLIGLEKVKQDFAQLANFIKVQQMREEKGLPVVSAIPKHFVFCGNPGTGKTSVASILANIYRELGILKKGHVVQVHNADLASGHRAVVIKDAVASALDGVLFIDEAYGLVQDDAQDAHGKEAVETLAKAMEDQRENLVVIVAGYPERMEKFVNANPRLKARFNKFLQFEDYSPEQMLELFDLHCSRNAFRMSPEARDVVKELFEQLYADRGEGFGNAREVLQVFESTIENQANRIITLPDVDEETLTTITDEDVDKVASVVARSRS